MQSASEIFEKAMKDEYYNNIMYKICRKNLASVCTAEEIDSVVMSTLWKCIKKYDPSKSKAKFSSYLYRSIANNSVRFYKKKISTRKEKQLIESNLPVFVDESAKKEAFEILESVKEINPEYYNILIQKFYYGMTNAEIGKANGYGKESARKKIKKALKMCRDIVYN
jgi:RNA polymerase sigma factor (sigma-70 family)